MTADGRIEIMIGSTVFGFEDQLNQICGLFEQLGYHPVCSHYRTMPTNPSKSNRENCLDAVGNCDVFFGIQRPFYGTGIITDRSITHEEMRRAIELKKPRWFVAHRDIRVARVLLKQYMYLDNGDVNPDFEYRPTKLLNDIRLIDLYNDTIQNDVPPPERIGHWTDEYFDVRDIVKVIHTQFDDVERINQIIQTMKAL